MCRRVCAGEEEEGMEGDGTTLVLDEECHKSEKVKSANEEPTPASPLNRTLSSPFSVLYNGLEFATSTHTSTPPAPADLPSESSSHRCSPHRCHAHPPSSHPSRVPPGRRKESKCCGHRCRTRPPFLPCTSVVLLCRTSSSSLMEWLPT
ncbi:hypothetical protein GALMADRAFT_592571 [Galerina marginata CBS 339.88]|uniref:Uncharacterized protein n=1 Tax=Galerina marginata (strain CBS 339.88) TaxID=685588 RepID=A0A067T498_GALM3|nr:hypothetical protein GALMADRAFT_592571 [Galerina marginata CBS 339.88]